MTEVHKTLRTFYQSEGKLLAAESPPQLRTIKVMRSKKDVDSLNRTFYLGFPYMQFYLTKEPCLYLSFSKKPVRRVAQDEIYFPFLPNVYSAKLKVCLAAHRAFEDYTFSPTEQTMEKVVEMFWDSRFYANTFWFGCWAVPEAIRKNDENFYDAVTKQFKAWEKGTKKEGVDFISNLDWPHAFKNFPRLLKSKKKFTDDLVFGGDNISALARKCLTGWDDD